MSTITASMVNELREKTGQPMMKCKQVLTEAEGDMQKAMDIFRKQGVKSSLLERTASEGRVFGATSSDGKSAAIVEINCNTDFTAKSDAISAIGNNLAKQLAADASADMNAASQAGLTEASQKTGENVRLGKTAIVSGSGKAGLYLYGITGKIGVVMAFSGSPSEELIKQLGGHIAFARPLGMTRDAVPAELVAKEREIAVEQAKATGKPQQIAEKIAEGKMNSFYAERVLLDQEFFNAQVFKGTISAHLKQSNVALEKYVRIEVGQG